MKKKPVPSHVKILSVFLLISMIMAGYAAWLSHKMQDDLVPPAIYMNSLEKSIRDSTQGTVIGKVLKLPPGYKYGRPNVFGDYLIGRFAQAHHDWAQASDVMQKIVRQNPEDLALLKRGMILAMGSGDGKTSFKIAHDIYKEEKDSALVLLFLIAESFHLEDYKAAEAYIRVLPQGSVSDFILPLLQSWTDAAVGKLNISVLNNSSIHMYHAILIADYLKQEDQIDRLLVNAENAQDLSIYDLERIADLYAHLGRNVMALNFYSQIMVLHPQPLIQEKINNLSDNTYKSSFVSVQTPQEGIANAFYDMARALIDEYSDESARVFGNIALYLDPDYTNAKLLLAHITSRNERYSEAIAYYKDIGAQDSGYLDARRKAAELLEQMEQVDEAVAELNILASQHRDIDAMIQIGNIYRRNDQFRNAIKSYNQAEKSLGDHVPEEYWHLLYVRGMAHERLGHWKKAEKDLKAALAFKPDHPYVLNYLGYAWADQGLLLDESLAMIRKAVLLRPSDGYITDSLGWVLYQQKQYEEAILHLERAVELLPYDPVVNDHLGDAYWKTGRKMEARFQWERAINYSDEGDHEGEGENSVEDIRRKLEHGLTTILPAPNLEANTDVAKEG